MQKPEKSHNTPVKLESKRQAKKEVAEWEVPNQRPGSCHVPLIILRKHGFGKRLYSAVHSTRYQQQSLLGPGYIPGKNFLQKICKSFVPAETCSYIRLKKYADFYLQISAGRNIQKSSVQNNYRFLHKIDHVLKYTDTHRKMYINMYIQCTRQLIVKYINCFEIVYRV